MKRLFLVVSAVLFVSVLFTASVCAEVPHLIRFQGKVTDKEGAPLNGAYNITFRIYNSGTAGSLMWSETQAAVPVNNGIFTVLLGNVAALDLPFDEPYWLSMEVSNDGEMAPRQAITSVGYAIHAEVADSIADVAVVPSGAIIMCKGTSCPVGYTRVAELDGKFIVGGATYNSVAGGSNTQTHNIPSHSHSFSATSQNPDPSGTSNAWNAPPGWDTPGNPDAAANFGNHRHQVSGTTSSWSGTTGSADNRPEFATVILCEKD